MGKRGGARGGERERERRTLEQRRKKQEKNRDSQIPLCSPGSQEKERLLETRNGNAGGKHHSPTVH